MGKSDQVVFVLVEGVTDEIVLGVLNKLLVNRRVYIHIARCDITSDRLTTPSNILKRIGESIRKFAEPNGLLPKNFQEVIHIIDTDGAYVSNDFVIQENANTQPFYEDSCIRTCRADMLIDRNCKKAAVLDRLIKTPMVYLRVPYSAYYFSCNLEHYFHNNANVPNEQKMALAEELDKRYVKDSTLFLRDVSQVGISASGSYEESWTYIQQGINSLSRFTNVNLLFSDKAKCGNLIKTQDFPSSDYISPLQVTYKKQ
jgi:hypothetical protein